MRVCLGDDRRLTIAFFVSGTDDRRTRRRDHLPPAGGFASAAVFCADPLYGALQLLGRQNIVAAFESLRGILMLLMSIGFLSFSAPR
jgi:hypothetical protein